jgi:putative transposase
MAYSEDLKRRVVAFVAEGGSKAQAARLFRIARSTLFRWLKQPPDHLPGKPGPKNSRSIDRQQLAELVAARPDLMIKEMAQILGAKRSTVHRNLQILGLRRKKNAALRTSP